MTAMPENQSAARLLLGWYDRHARDLPWRARTGVAPDPYAVWLSEIMLQQTTVAAAGPYFARFLARWTDVSALAAAPMEEILKEWAGLGYYARGRNLKACAMAIMREHGGNLPADEAALLRLPGIGPYTAAAIAAIAFGRATPVLDGNVERVVARLFAIDTPLPGAKKPIREHLARLVPEDRPGDFAQAMMDLGATVCAPRRADCGRCPLSGGCVAAARGIALDLPVKAPKRPRPVRSGQVFWLERGDGAVVFRRRPPRGLLGGMLELPGSDWAKKGAQTSREDVKAHAPVVARWRKCAGTVEHTFTHFHLRLEVWTAQADGGGHDEGGHDEGGHALPDGLFWLAADEIAGEALPSVMRKAVALARAAQD